MIQPLEYPRNHITHKNVLCKGVFYESSIYHVPCLPYPYHIFLLKDGVQIQKHYRKTLKQALTVFKAAMRWCIV